MIKKIIALLIIGGIGYGIYYFISDYFENKDAWKIEVTNQSIIVREQADQTTNNIDNKKVYAGEIYNVVDFKEDETHVWYKIEYDNGKFGWVGSEKGDSYVKEINNPNREPGDTVEYQEIDYTRPKIRTDVSEFSTYDINTINYDHFTVEEDSEYDIDYEVYFEEFPKDTNTPQYWVHFIVTDEHGNSTDFVHKVIFEINPSKEEVKLFEELDR